MSSLLYRLAHWCVRRRRIVLGAWLAALIGLIAISGLAGGSTSDSFDIPGTESQQAVDLLDERFPSESGSTARIVLATDDGARLDDPDQRRAIAAMLDQIAEQPDVMGVVDPFTAQTVSPEGTIGYADVRYEVSASEVPDEAYEGMEEAAATAEDGGVQVEFGGEVWSASEEEETGTSELIGLGVAIVVLLLSFGSVVAMGLPVATALIGVGVGTAGLGAVSAVIDLSSTASILMTMIGLAVGIDYALFIVTRHRQNLAEGHDVEEAAARANATAGGAVVFAGISVVIALAGLVVVGIPFLSAMGLAAAGGVLVAVAIAITLLPALLGFAGHKIDRLRIGRARTGSAAESHKTLSARWARRVTARPGVSLAAGLGFMVLLSLPMFSMRLGMPDDGTKTEDTTQRQAYDLLAEGFGPGFNGPLTMVVDLSDAVDPDAAMAEITTAAEEYPGVFAVGETSLNEAGDTAVVPVIPMTGPASDATEDLVHHLRSEAMPDIEAATGADVAVSGPTAGNIDVSDKLGSALPIFMIVVIGLTVVLLLVAFRSLLVPIKAAIGILLSISAALGITVAIFQWGWLKDLVGLEETLPIVSFIPMLMFAVLFGLSMDYEVFILSRVREDWVRTGDARASVVSGLTSSARVITAAALIMTSVFASFALQDDPVTRMLAIGFSAAVLLDATVVRMVIVPATMALFNRANWWLPRWLDRLLPNVDIEGEHLMEKLQHDNVEHIAVVGDAVTANGSAADGDRESELVGVAVGAGDESSAVSDDIASRTTPHDR